MGTTGGLARYDGRHLRNFAHDPLQPATLSHAAVLALLEDSQRGVLWVGSLGGLDRLDLLTERVVRLPLPAELSPRDRRVQALVPADAGRVWVAFRGGLYLFDPALARFSAWPAGRTGAFGVVTAMIPDGAGGVWVARADKVSHIGAGADVFTEGRSFSPANGLSSAPLRADDLPVNRLALDAQGRLWVGMTGGLQTWRVEPGGVRPDPLGASLQLPRQMVHALLLDRDQAMWIGIGELAVLHRWRADAARLETFRHLPGVSGSLSSHGMASLMQDRAGVLWVGSTETGVNLVDLSSRSFSNYLSVPGDTQTLSSPIVMATLMDGPEHAWVGSYGGGLNHLHLASGKVRQIALPDMPISHVKALAPAAMGRLWVGGDRGMVLFDPRLVLLCHKRSLPFVRKQHGHLGSVLSKAEAISSRKVVMDDGTWRCVRRAAARLVMRG